MLQLQSNVPGARFSLTRQQTLLLRRLESLVMEGRRQFHGALTTNTITATYAAERNTSSLHGIEQRLHVHDLNLEVLGLAVGVGELDIVGSR